LPLEFGVAWPQRQRHNASEQCELEHESEPGR